MLSSGAKKRPGRAVLSLGISSLVEPFDAADYRVRRESMRHGRWQVTQSRGPGGRASF
jgi:hypothetical protein